MRDVAEAAGVSVQTVSNVVNDRSAHTTPETAERVRELIAELGFTPNRVARGLRSSRTQTLAFLVLDAAARFLADPMTDLFLAGLGDETRRRSHDVLIRANEPGVSLETLIEPLVDGRVDGAVLFLSGAPKQRGRYVEELRKVDSPFLLLQEHLENDGVATVCADDRGGAYRLCRHLISRGHRRIGFLTASHTWSAIEDRLLGYRDAHAEARLPVDESLLRHSGEFKAGDAAWAAGALLDAEERPTAIMCGNDLLALGVLRAARERGLATPDELAVTGFNDFDFAGVVEPALTTVGLPGYEMGRYAAAALISAVRSGEAPRSRRFPVELLLRDSA